MPEFYGHIVWDQLTAAGVFDEFLADGCAGVEGTKHISASEVVEARDAAQYLSLRPLATAGSAEDEEGFDAGGVMVVGHDFG